MSGPGRVVVGIDAGGTHFRALVADSSGKELARADVPAARVMAGLPDPVVASLRDAVERACAQAGVTTPVSALWAGIAVTIVAPIGNSTEKNAAMRELGARLIEHGSDFDEARAHAFALADAEAMTFAPSFHADLVVGVATWALELFRTAPALDVLYVPIGLGSGICGAILARDLLGLSTEIVGVQSTGAASYALSFATGRVIATNRADTLADGMATRQPDADALAIIRRGASHIVTVDDEAVAEAIRIYWSDTHNLA